MSDHRSDFDKVHTKLDTIDVKLDDHLERISKTEADIHWLKGHVKIVTTLVITLFVGLVLAYVKIKAT